MVVAQGHKVLLRLHHQSVVRVKWGMDDATQMKEMNDAARKNEWTTLREESKWTTLYEKEKRMDDAA